MEIPICFLEDLLFLCVICNSSACFSSSVWYIIEIFALLDELVTNFSERSIAPPFKGPADQADFLNCWTLEDGTDRLSRNVRKWLPNKAA